MNFICIRLIKTIKMQSHSETLRKYGHNRRPSYGKAMPVSALLMNFSSPQNDTKSRDGASPDSEKPPMLFTLSEVNAHYQDSDPKIESEQIDCSVNAENEFVFLSLRDELPEKNDIETCPLTELCNLLCDSSCKKFEQTSTDNDNVGEINACANDRRKFLSSMIVDNVTSVNDHKSEDDLRKNDEISFDEKMKQNPLEKLKINEALVRTSMMTSPAACRRLAARKIEMELDAASELADDNDYVPPRQLLMFLVRYIPFENVSINSPHSNTE